MIIVSPYYSIIANVQIMFYCKESGPIPSHPVQLDEGFISWLEKLSTNLEEQSEKAVIIIDNVDLITVCL